MTTLVTLNLRAQTRLPTMEEFSNRTMNSMALIAFSSNESNTSVKPSNSEWGTNFRNLLPS